VLRSTWPVLIFVGGIVWWAAGQNSSLSGIQKNEARIAALETRAAAMESGISQLQLKIDAIKEDLSLIKGAVIK
jgi:hypothetical protein